MSLKHEAAGNFVQLCLNPYPGRGIVLGETASHAVQIYWIMGRSENSRNRVFGLDGQRLFTEAADPSKVKDPALIIYNAMNVEWNNFVVSNGSQTDQVTPYFKVGSYISALVGALQEFQYEPDSPNFTPRITGASCILDDGPKHMLSMLRKSPGGTGCDRTFWEYSQIGRNLGRCITTYSGDGDPLPSFTGEPYLVPIEETAEATLDMYQKNLSPENLVALAVRFIYLGGGFSSHTVIWNRHKKAL